MSTKRARPRAFIGREIPCPFPGEASGQATEKSQLTHLGTALSNAFSQQFDFVALPLVSPGLRRDQSVDLKNGTKAPATFSDKELTPSQWSTSVLGRVQTFPFAQDPTLQQTPEPQRQLRAAEEALSSEIDWAVHLGLSAVSLPPPRRPSECALYARAINKILETGHSNIHLWLEVPLVNNGDVTTGQGTAANVSSSTKVGASTSNSSSGSKIIEESSWQIWNRMRCYTNFNSRLHACLVLTTDLPSINELSNWMGEPVKGCIIPTSIFLTNKQGFPVLSQYHQNFVINLFNYNVQFILRPPDSSMEDQKLVPYMQYLVHLQTKRPELTDEEVYTRSYYDYLQAPLQPLMDNLESATYDTFEKDPIKYSQYQKAVSAALQTLPSDINGDGPVIIMVVGAGRGPLVAASLRAADELGRTVKMYAVEKNPNAVITLRHRVLSELMWRDRVEVISGDMRDWNAPGKLENRLTVL